MDEAAASHGNQEGPPLPSIFARIPLLLFEPTKLFQALRARPAFWGAIFFAAALIAISTVLIPVELQEEAARQRVESMGIEMPERPEGAPEGAEQLGRIFGILGAFIGLPIWLAIVAGVLTLIFRFGMGYEGSYRQYLSVAAHATLIVALGAVLLTPLQLAFERADLTLNLGAFVPFLETGFLARFLRGIDLFTLWCAVLLGLGIAVVDGTRPARTAIGVMVGLMVFFTGAGAAIAGLFQRGQ